MQMIEFADFEKCDLRVGRVLLAEPFPEARKPSIKLTADFGPEIGVLRTSAQITEHYSPDSLGGQLVVGLVNIPPRRIAGFESQFLLCGFADSDGAVILAKPDRAVPLGAKLF